VRVRVSVYYSVPVASEGEPVSVIRMSAAAANGELVLRVPMPTGEYDVQLVVTPKPAGIGPARTPTPEELGWPPGYFERVVGAIPEFDVGPREIEVPDRREEL
jgi:hypothetical protein